MLDIGIRSLGMVLVFAVLGSSASARTIVFWQTDFPTIGSQTVTRHALEQALGVDEQAFVNLDHLVQPEALAQADLLVLPYGSAFPEKAWPSILHYLRAGGNLLIVGGQPFRVPVTGENGRYAPGPAQDAYSRELGILHTYEAPQHDGKTFAWKDGYSFLPNLSIEAEKFFVLEGRAIDGMGYMINRDDEKIAAPVVLSNHLGPTAGDMLGYRWVYLDFQPRSGYWDTNDGILLIHTAAEYARQGAVSFWVETQFSSFKTGEVPSAVVHLRIVRKGPEHPPWTREVKLDLVSSDGALIAERLVPCSANALDANVDFTQPLKPGFYRIRATYYDSDKPREYYQNGFWVEDASLLNSGPALGVKGDFLTRDGKPFFPFGTNYFTTEENGWDFSGPRNAATWESDFAEMARHGTSFVRTGVWGGQIKFLDQDGAVTERFLRNVEAYLLCARKNNIAVNFTFFAFDPQTTLRLGESNPVAFLPGTNPYLDPETIRAEQNYMLSIVNRFKDVPYLSWDLINEPSFSNPKHLWRGNTPDNDPAEIAAWRKWLKQRYGNTEDLTAAWSLTPDQVNSFDSVPLPSEHDLSFDLEHGDIGQARAGDYNLFAQDMFSGWVETMVAAIRSTGSKQPIDVGQDEGGVRDRLLNQFYGGAGLSFTTNHTYRANDALLWDSLAAKVPGVPNIVGETGYQPVILPNGQWQFDEITGASLIERKWVAGFAGGTSGAMSWDWAREIYFGIKRSDGSSKIWENTMRQMGKFAEEAAPYATELRPPEVAIVLPQSLQLSTFKMLAIEAQQVCVRALYGYAHSEAYVVGEEQIQRIGNPKLIILPSPWVLSQESWELLLIKAKDGATLLVSGRFDEDPHFRATGRQTELGIDYRPGRLRLMNQKIQWPGGSGRLTYSGPKTDFLERAFLPDGSTFVEKTVGRGKILFVALPLELNDNLKAVGEVYQYALKTANVDAVYSSTLEDPGILICPTRFPHATLYAISSESDDPEVSFRDARSTKEFSARLAPGHGALLLVGENGDLLASYHWK